jgi:hypothetical protein
MTDWTRRRLLRGMMRGSAVVIGLPLLDTFLDGNGTALAATGAPIPTRFGTWFWGCGVNAGRWFPSKTGRDYDFKDELKPIEPYRDKLTVFSNFNCNLDSKPNLVHWSGIMATLSGCAPLKGGVGGGNSELPTLDCLVSDAIGKGTRFRSIEVACTGDPSVSYSMRAGSTVNPSEVDPINLYRRMFANGFQDPNQAEFTPDPEVMLRQSVLSSIKDERDDLLRSLGSADRQRVDQYFTSVRQIEQQLGTMLEKPAPAEACLLPREPGRAELGPTWEAAGKTHDLMAELVVMALACGQTKVFNLALSTAGSNLRKSGEPVSLHELTHEEPVDEKLGYQPKATFFIERSMETFATMLKLMDQVKEGDGTLLDHSLVLATSESNFAKIHSVDSLPIMVAGQAGGKWKSGQHIAGSGEASSRVGLTIQQVLGMPVTEWGEGSMRATKPITEVMA